MKLVDISVGSRTSFHETWVIESPSGLVTNSSSAEDMYRQIKDDIVPLINHPDISIIKLSHGVNKIVVGTTAYYWYGTAANFELGTSLAIKHEAYIVNLTGKNPKLKGRPPFASDLYSIILNDCGENIRLLSDKQLSDEGYNIWKRLFAQGHKISVYDAKDPGHTFKQFESLAEMDKYFDKTDAAYSRYQYILSKSSEEMFAVRSSFNTRRYREDLGLSLTDE